MILSETKQRVLSARWDKDGSLILRQLERSANPENKEGMWMISLGPQDQERLAKMLATGPETRT